MIINIIICRLILVNLINRHATVNNMIEKKDVEKTGRGGQAV